MKKKKKEIVYSSDELSYKSLRKIGDYIVCITSNNKLLNIIDDGKILDKIKPGISLKDLELLLEQIYTQCAMCVYKHLNGVDYYGIDL